METQVKTICVFLKLQTTELTLWLIIFVCVQIRFYVYVFRKFCECVRVAKKILCWFNVLGIMTIYRITFAPSCVNITI